MINLRIQNVLADSPEGYAVSLAYELHIVGYKRADKF